MKSGNITQESLTRHFEWDYADRMRVFRNQISTSEPTVYSQYFYDAGGNRVMKFTRKQGGNWQWTVYIDGIFEWTQNSDAERQSIAHIMDDKSRIASVRNGDAMGDNTPDIKYNLEDHLGSSMTLLDENGSWVNWEEYYPFGETSLGSYAKKRYRYCGKERDEESGFYYYGARYYLPWLCRFASVDPLALKNNYLSPYCYADNNPILMNDPTGMDSEGGEKSGNENQSKNGNSTNEKSKSIDIKVNGTAFENREKTQKSLPKNAEDGTTITFEYSEGGIESDTYTYNSEIGKWEHSVKWKGKDSMSTGGKINGESDSMPTGSQGDSKSKETTTNVEAKSTVEKMIDKSSDIRSIGSVISRTIYDAATEATKQNNPNIYKGDNKSTKIKKIELRKKVEIFFKKIKVISEYIGRILGIIDVIISIDTVAKTFLKESKIFFGDVTRVIVNMVSIYAKGVAVSWIIIGLQISGKLESIYKYMNKKFEPIQF